MEKTKLIIKAKDGRRVEKFFDTYEEMTEWVEKNLPGVELNLTHALFDQEPTIEVYQEKSRKE